MRIRKPDALAALFVALATLCASPAWSVVLDVDPTASDVGGTPASGSMAVSVGAPLPVPSRTTFELTALSVEAGPLSVGLDPSLARPGYGIVDPDGSFLVPTLYLLLSEGGALTPLVIPDLTGSLRAGGDDCVYTYCLDTTFSVATSGGLIDVTISAIPEPGTAALVGLGLFCIGRVCRREEYAR